jgi:hypothetical protein
MALSLVVAVAAPAHATTLTILTDDFETSANRSNWQFSNSGGDGWGQFDFPSPAHSGSVFGELFSPWYDAGGWSAMSRTLTRAWWAGNSCNVFVWLASRDNATVNVEVIDPNTWTYMALKTVTVQTETRAEPLHYIQVMTPAFTPNPSSFVFRVSVVNTDGDYSRRVLVDDVKYTCASIRG